MRGHVRKAANELKAAVKSLGEDARSVARKAGTVKTVTIYKGVTVSKDKPTRIKR